MTKLELALAGAILQKAASSFDKEVYFTVEYEQDKLAYVIEGTLKFENHNEVNHEWCGMMDLTTVIDSVTCEIDTALVFDEYNNDREIDVHNIVEYVEHNAA